MNPELIEKHLSFWKTEAETSREKFKSDPEEKLPLIEALYNLALIYGEMKEWRLAQELLREVLDLAPTWAEAWNNLGAVLWSMAEPLRARSAWEEALRLDPEGEGGRVAKENLVNCPMPPSSGLPDHH